MEKLEHQTLVQSMFLDDTACNLASMNLLKFLEDGEFNSSSFCYATKLWTITLEISVMMAQFPSKEIAQRSYDYRTLGLGYANIGGLFMNMGQAMIVLRQEPFVELLHQL